MVISHERLSQSSDAHLLRESPRGSRSTPSLEQRARSKVVCSPKLEFLGFWVL